MMSVGSSVRKRIATLALFLCTIGVACATSHDPFKSTGARVRIARVDTIALPRLSVHPDLVDVERARALIEPRVITLLREGGFEVISPEEWDRRWLDIAHAVGEIWDPVTGVRDDERYEAAVTALRHELTVERGVDAIVHVGLYLEKVEGSGRSPMLCGKFEDVYWPGGLPFNARVTIAYGMCLGAYVTDMEGRELYGIHELLEFVDTYALQTHASRPLDERLRDLERVEEAIEATVGPLARARSGR
jgi:hypothetical protein